MKRILKACFCVLLVVGLSFVIACSSKKKEKNNGHKPIMIVDFDESLGKGCSEYTYIFSNPDDVKRYDILKGLWETNSLKTVPEAETPKIPKILHQIWVGPKTPPSYFVTFQEKWRNLHPDWEYHLWTDSELEDLNFELKDLIDASPNYAEKSDIIRSELLDRFGGVYLDVDMDPFQSLDELHKKYDFYCGIENPHKIATTNNRLWLGISIIASAPNHPIMKRWKELIRARWNEVNNNYNSPIERVINHTYFPFSMAFFEKYQDGNLTNLALPTTYFYPLAADHAAKRRATVRAFREMFYDLLIDLRLKRPRPFSRIQPETIAVHYWGNTWLPSQNEQLKDLQHQLDLLRKESYRMQGRLRLIESNQSKQTPASQQQDPATKQAA